MVPGNVQKAAKKETLLMCKCFVNLIKSKKNLKLQVIAQSFVKNLPISSYYDEKENIFGIDVKNLYFRDCLFVVTSLKK